MIHDPRWPIRVEWDDSEESTYGCDSGRSASAGIIVGLCVVIVAALVIWSVLQ